MESLFKEIQPDASSRKLIFAWLLLAVMSLVFAGVFAFLLAMSRTPGVQNLWDSGGFIYTALVVHVVLSVVIWFLTFCGVLMVFSFFAFRNVSSAYLPLGWLGFVLAAVGTTLLILPAFLPGGEPSLNNYIPVLQTPVYYTGLFLFGSGLFFSLLHAFLGFLSNPRSIPSDGVFSQISFGMGAYGVSVLVALICFALAYKFMPPMATPKAYFERFFWGGGHVLQASNTIGMLCAWLLLTRLAGGTVPIPARAIKFFFVITVFVVLPAPVIYFKTNMLSREFKEYFTAMMQWGFNPAAIMIGLGIAMSFFSGKKGPRLKPMWTQPAFVSLFFSLLLFGAGGLIAIFIVGSDVRIPSHYHGVIGAVTISFMGLSYYILPLLGRDIYFPKLARVQPYLYGIGQLLFVLGLFLAGSHGVPRKTYGEAQNLDHTAKVIGMIIMGTGGLIAISGGAAYVWNMLFSMFRKKR